MYAEKTFTIVHGTNVQMGVEAYSIEAAAQPIRKAYQAKATHGRKTNSIQSLSETKHLVLTLSLFNKAGEVIESAVIIEEQPAKAIGHQHIMGGGTLVCSCGSEKFYQVGRSLFSENLECVGCEKMLHPMTETGAST